MSASRDIAIVQQAVISAMEIEGREPVALGYACVEVPVDGRIIRIEISAPRKPWISAPLAPAVDEGSGGTAAVARAYGARTATPSPYPMCRTFAAMPGSDICMCGFHRDAPKHQPPRSNGAVDA